MKALIALVFGVLFLVCGLGGLYIGFVTCLFGGIVELINQIKAPVTEAGPVAWAFIKIVFFEVPIYLGWVLAALFGGAAAAALD